MFQFFKIVDQSQNRSNLLKLELFMKTYGEQFNNFQNSIYGLVSYKISWKSKKSPFFDFPQIGNNNKISFSSTH